jgi:hypothetical protein
MVGSAVKLVISVNMVIVVVMPGSAELKLDFIDF